MVVNYTNESDLVLGALEVLCNLSEDGLKSNRTKVKEALQKLQQRIEGCTSTPGSPYSQQSSTNSNGSPSARIPHHDLPADGGRRGLSPRCKGAASVPRLNHHSRVEPLGCASNPEPPIHQLSATNCDGSPSCYSAHNSSAAPRDDVQSLVQNLNSVFNAIQGFVRDLGPTTTELQLPKQTVDIRVANIVNADGAQPDDNAHKLVQLRRILSQRSLALEYDVWDRQQNGISSLDRRKEALKGNDSPRSHPRTLLPDRFLVRFSQDHLGSVKKAIKHGIKLLCFESILRDVGGAGFSSILIWRYTDWRRLQYKHLGQLAKAFRNQAHMRDFAEQSADWLLQWQIKYDEWCQSINVRPNISINADPGPSTKSDANRNCKRPVDTWPAGLNKRLRFSPVSTQSTAQHGSNLNSSLDKPAVEEVLLTNGDSVNVSDGTANLAAQRNTQQFDGFNLMPTPDIFQRRPASPPTDYMEIEQPHDFGTELNRTTTNVTHNPSTPASFPNLTPENLPTHNVWDHYPMGNAAPDNPITHNAWEFYPNNYATPHHPTPYNVWSYPWLDATIDNTMVHGATRSSPPFPTG